MTRGVRQGCPMSGVLFNIYMYGLEGWLQGRQVGGVRIGGAVVRSITYADDIVLFGKGVREMEELLKETESFLGRRGLQLSTTKSKIMICRRGKRERGRVVWGGLEVVKEIRYLGVVLGKRGGLDGHVRERVSKARRVMAAVWGLGER